MVSKSGEMGQVAFEIKGGHLVTDFFHCLRSGRVDGGSDFLKCFLCFSRERGNVLINRNEAWLGVVHGFPFYSEWAVGNETISVRADNL